MKLNIKDFKINPDQETCLELNCFEVNQTTNLTCNNDYITCRMDSFGSKVLQIVPLKSITGILLQFQRDTKFLAAFCCFLATAVALLVVGICVGSSSAGLFIMASVSLFLSLICLLIFFLSKTILLGIQNGSSDFAIKIFCKPTAEVGRAKFEEAVELIQNKMLVSK